jgi:hypothetical protein
MVCFVLSLGSQSKRDDGLEPCAVVLEKANHRLYRLRYAGGLLGNITLGQQETDRVETACDSSHDWTS